MYLEDIKKQSELFLLEILKTAELELFEYSFHRSQRTLAVQVLIDRPEGGITIEECSRINRRLYDFFEEEIHMEGDYTVEVSSPGLDRPLSTERDFRRIGVKPVRFHLKEKVENKLEYVGIVEAVTTDRVSVRLEGAEEPIEIHYDNIQKAVQQI